MGSLSSSCIRSINGFGSAEIFKNKSNFTDACKKSLKLDDQSVDFHSFRAIQSSLSSISEVLFIDLSILAIDQVWKIVNIEIKNGKVYVVEAINIFGDSADRINNFKGRINSNSIKTKLMASFDLENIDIGIEKDVDNGESVCLLIFLDSFIRYKLKVDTYAQANIWLRCFREELMLHGAISGENMFDFSKLCDQGAHLTISTELPKKTYYNTNMCENSDKYNTDNFELTSNDYSIGSASCISFNKLPPPSMNIVILVVGTRGDVQPFIHLGQELKKRGNRVRLATHAEYRDDVVTKGGLEYYPLAGDPRKLSEYMVKTQGRLLPNLLNAQERKELPEKMKMLEEICFSCLPACCALDPEDLTATEFLADAIIANPIASGHIHCAEALSIPLPWCPTKCFPHPLANMSYETAWSNSNYFSYKLVDEFMWLGMGSIINDFRQKALGLAPIRFGENGDSILNDLKVPISHMWSPSLVPKCSDWPSHVDVVGDFRLHESSVVKFTPDSKLLKFLKSADSSKPLYIGFGSMVIEDSTRLVEIIKAASAKVGCKILLQNGWTKYADDYKMLSKQVMVIGSMPHEWLFSQVCGVIHHGGAGTTSAGLRAGNPTFICPFFGDQHFWAEMVYRAGVGPKGCPITLLTVDIMARSILKMRERSMLQATEVMKCRMLREDGVANAVESFERNLVISNILCEVSIFEDADKPRMARVYCQDCRLKICPEIDTVIHRKGSGRSHHVRVPFRGFHWGILEPKTIFAGIEQGVGAVAHEVVGGLWDLLSKPVTGAIKGGIIGAVGGVGTGVISVIVRPILGGKIFIDRIVSGSANTFNSSKQIYRPQNILARLCLQQSTSEKSSETRGKVGNSNRLRSKHKKDIDKAYLKSIRLLALWNSADDFESRVQKTSNINKLLRSQDEFQFEEINVDDQPTISFAELAWRVAKYSRNTLLSGELDQV